MEVGAASGITIKYKTPLIRGHYTRANDDDDGMIVQRRSFFLEAFGLPLSQDWKTRQPTLQAQMTADNVYVVGVFSGDEKVWFEFKLLPLATRHQHRPTKFEMGLHLAGSHGVSLVTTKNGDIVGLRLLVSKVSAHANATLTVACQHEHNGVCSNKIQRSYTLHAHQTSLRTLGFYLVIIIIRITLVITLILIIIQDTNAPGQGRVRRVCLNWYYWLKQHQY